MEKEKKVPSQDLQFYSLSHHHYVNTYSLMCGLLLQISNLTCVASLAMLTAKINIPLQQKNKQNKTIGY